MTGQLERLGFSFDWERSFMSSDALMYRWSQWLFLVAARGGADLPRHGQRRLVRQLPDDARLDPGRARGHVLALPRPGAPDRAAAVVPAHQRLPGGERQAPRRARRERPLGRGRDRLAGDRARARRRRRARSARARRGAARGLHAPRRRAGAGALRADLAATPRRRRVGRRSRACASSSSSFAPAAGSAARARPRRSR